MGPPAQSSRSALLVYALRMEAEALMARKASRGLTDTQIHELDRKAARLMQERGCSFSEAWLVLLGEGGQGELRNQGLAVPSPQQPPLHGPEDPSLSCVAAPEVAERQADASGSGESAGGEDEDPAPRLF